PGLAIPLAQYAAAWNQGPGACDDVYPGAHWYGVFDLLILTAWLALGLALLKVFGVLAPGLLIYMAGGSAYAWVTMRLVMRVCRWRARKRLKGRKVDGGG